MTIDVQANIHPDVQVSKVQGITILDDGAPLTEDLPAESDSDSELRPSLVESEAPELSPIRVQPALAKEWQHSQPQAAGPDAELQEFQNVQERREELKQQMAVTASRLLQNPEANLPTMRSLLTLATDKDSQVSF